jgi:hypothetical protein
MRHFRYSVVKDHRSLTPRGDPASDIGTEVGHRMTSGLQFGADRGVSQDGWREHLKRRQDALVSLVHVDLIEPVAQFIGGMSEPGPDLPQVREPD